MKVNIRFVHAIKPLGTDVSNGVYMEDIWESTSPTTWARCLRDAGVLHKGTRVRAIRRERDPETGQERVLVFPFRSGWHCVVVTEAQS